ncbi:uncharacterized protein ARMOST_17752 [Armillaria ostoyae]|uniref:Uncharacterized protein n=1 Tax=Armillaria ostoyae TaxID=47428 RepID=A0A284S010_ARMOS|nr:uncharacterized protein ARMOST_17752 [Armillaria ostoyae]
MQTSKRSGTTFLSPTVIESRFREEAPLFKLLYDASFPISESPQIKKTSPKRYSNSDCPMREWQGYDDKLGY